MVLASVGLGLTYDEVCKLIINPQTGMPISKHTLIRAFREELDRAQSWVKMKVLGSLYKNATENNNVTAQIFMAKCRYGWKSDEDEEEPPQLPTIDVDQNHLEAARRVAFMLAKGQKQLVKK